MRKKNKITPEREKEIRIIATALPKLQAYSNAGQAVFHRRKKEYSWDEMTTEQKDQFPNDRFNPRKGKAYVFYISVPAIVDHYANLCDIYRNKGEAGVETYVEEINEISNKAIAAAKSIQPPAEKDVIQVPLESLEKMEAKSRADG